MEVTKPDDPRGVGRNWNLWIVVAVVAVLACVCVIGAAALVGGSLLITGSEASLPGSGHEATLERTLDVSPGTALQVDNFAGTIDVEAGSTNQIQITAVKHGPAGSNLDRIDVRIEQQGTTVRVRTTRPAGLSNLYVSLQIRVPEGTPLDLSSGSGGIEVEGIRGDVRAETGSGSVIATSIVGNVVLNSGSGSVEARNVEGSLSIDSGSGSLTVQGINGDLEAHTGSGGIDVLGAEGNVRLDTSSGTVEYQGAPTGDCRFETGTGSVVLRLPGELDFRIRADTGSGSVNVQFEVEGRVARQHVEGVVGTGQEAAIVVSTGSGGVDVFQY
jgi:hypothetical protein